MPISLTRKHIQIIALSSGIVMLAAVICVLMQNYAQRWLFDRGVAILSERIGTVVRIDSVDVSLVGRKVTVYGMEVELMAQSETPPGLKWMPTFPKSAMWMWAEA